MYEPSRPARRSGVVPSVRTAGALRLLLVLALLTGWLILGPALMAPRADAATPPVINRTPETVSALALPTTQINGIAWTQVVVGNTVYVGGSFSSARPAGSALGSNETPRANLLAYNVTTGALITTFAPKLNAEVKALAVSPDKTKLYVGGNFTTVNGVATNRIAAFSTATGGLISTFKAGLNGEVSAIAATASTVYAAGDFSTAGTPSTARVRLAAFSAGTGALTKWAPTLDNTPSALVLTPDQTKLVVGGRFAHVDGVAAQGISAVSASTGAVVSWPVNKLIHNGNSSSGIFSLNADNDTIYASNWDYGTGNFEGIVATSTSGAVKWLADCHGDTYAVFSMNNIVYDAGHTHTCANIGGFGEHTPRWNWRSMAFSKSATQTVLANNQAGKGYGNFAGQPAPSIVYWFPQFTVGTVTKLDQAVWSLSGNGRYLVAGGEFPSVNGHAQQGLVRFAVPTSATDPTQDSGPTQLGGVTNPTLSLITTRSTPSPSASAAPTTSAPSSAGPSDLSSSASAAPSSASASASSAPSTPTTTPTPSTSYAVKVDWTANWDRDDRSLSYKLVRSDRGLAAPISVQTQSSSFWSLPKLSFTDPTVLSGVTYRYRVYEYDPNNTTTPGTYSDDVSITIP